MTRYLYQKHQRYVAQIPAGMAELATTELAALGARDIAVLGRSLRFTATPPQIYAIVYQARCVSRLLAPLLNFPCDRREALYRAGRQIRWEQLFHLRQTFAIFANVIDTPGFTNSHFASQCLKDAIADHFRQKMGKRPSVDRRHPHIWINLYIHNGQGTISLDLGGGALHRRGYRRQSVIAPIQEIVAAAMVQLSGWRGDRPLHDPMCGSGTLLCEALMHTCRIPAGHLRDAGGLPRLPDFDGAQWKRVKAAADRQMEPLTTGLISGSDKDHRAIQAARQNCRRLPGGRQINLYRKDFREHPGLQNGVILCNPPYGLRLERGAEIGTLYKALGDWLKQRCSGSSAFIYFGNRELIKKIGLKPAWKKPLRNAELDGRVVKYELY
ncbi:MAG: THUMP domain-containing protein [Desulfosarcinaceae bacterium]|nr:THUMP domain-containing protein [Desulfosarcinaceae bacterium]